MRCVLTASSTKFVNYARALRITVFFVVQEAVEAGLFGGVKRVPIEGAIESVRSHEDGIFQSRVDLKSDTMIARVFDFVIVTFDQKRLIVFNLAVASVGSSRQPNGAMRKLF